MPVTVPAPALTAFVTRIFTDVGAPPEEAAQVAEHLVGSNLRGHDSHGVIRTFGYVQMVREGRLKPGAPLTIERETASTALVSGGWNLGVPVAIQAMDLAVRKAKETGVAFVSMHDAGHIGRVGAYGDQAQREGMIAMGGVNSPGGRLVAAFGGSHRRTGTSPIMIAMPTANPDEPFILDMATSVVAEGKLKVAVNAQKPVPDGWILDGAGNASNDARDFYGTGDHPDQGTLLPVGGPVGGYKGFGLNLAIEAFSGILSGAGTSIAGERGTNGVWFMALDPSGFLPVEMFTSGLEELIEFAKEPPLAAGHSEILVAGEPERRRMAQRLEDGIDLDDETWRQINAAAEETGTAAPEMGWS